MVVAANFKTNHTRASTTEFISFVNDFIANGNDKHQVRIYPCATAFDNFTLQSVCKVGAQNFYPVDNGSFTGEVGFDQLAEFDIDSLLIGHSERRHILGESQEFIARKFNFAKERNKEIIYCVGEPLAVREAGIEAVMQYLWEQFSDIDITYPRLIVAYEPVWAIGTGLVANIEDIAQTHARLREKIDAPLLYGGSVKVENISEILGVANCDGVLVGTASWQKEAFCNMIKLAQMIQ
ncbi:MAG: triose-phosphate isomerase [Sulfurospirillum sp.]|nr:triose-phosphate isomerase [Sulfurospirillum sp.]